MYDNLDGSEPSVHLCDWPEPGERDSELEWQMEVARDAVELGRKARAEGGVNLRQPLREAVIVAGERERAALERFAGLVRDELNVKQLRFVGEADELGRWELKPNYRTLGPRFGKRMPRIADDPTRRAVIRAHNIVTADYFRKLSDRMTPAAIIPMHHPDEAVEELEFVTKQLGSKVGMFGSGMSRRVPSTPQSDPDGNRLAVYYDVLAIDSEYDYEPVWEKCEELGIAPTFHSSGSNQGLRNSPSNFVYNHIGHFAAAGHAVSKAIFLGGVTRRFPKLRFAFLEGGVGWAAQLFGDLIEHWERRNRKALEKMDPRTLDRGMLMSLAEKYGDPDVAAALQARDGWPDKDANLTGGVEDLDDFSACKITRKEDWVDLYAKPFYFGCEADDRMNGTAFSKNNPFGAKLNALYSSDIGHFDVIDMRDPLPEAYELVEDGVISDDNFRDFTFANAVHLWGTQNPRFFEGTAVAKEAAAELARAATR